LPRVHHFLLLLLTVTGCAAPRPAEPVRHDPELAVVRKPVIENARLPLVPRDGAGDLAVARVGDAEIRRSDLGDFTIRYFRDQASEALTHLVDERIIAAEAQSNGITVPDSLIDSEVEAEIKERENTVRVQYGADVSLERFLRDRYGVTLEGHRRDLVRLVRTRLLRDRVIRYQQMGQVRVVVLDAVYATQDQARMAADAARNGADFGTLAREQGVRDEVALPPVPRDELSPEELGDAVFALSSGEISDPIAVTEGDRTLYHIFKLVRKLPARSESWSSVEDEVEGELLTKPLEPWEYLQWAGRMRTRYRVEVL
jgi:parvulin-like peptidyl-prolyl isomerase